MNFFVYIYFASAGLYQLHNTKYWLKVDHIVVDLRADSIPASVVFQSLLQGLFRDIQALSHLVSIPAPHFVGPEDPGQSDQSVVRPDPAAELLLAVGRDALVEDTAGSGEVMAELLSKDGSLLRSFKPVADRDHTVAIQSFNPI